MNDESVGHMCLILLAVNTANGFLEITPKNNKDTFLLYCVRMKNLPNTFNRELQIFVPLCFIFLYLFRLVLKFFVRNWILCVFILVRKATISVNGKFWQKLNIRTRYHSIYDTEGFNKLIYSNFNVWILTKILQIFMSRTAS